MAQAAVSLERQSPLVNAWGPRLSSWGLRASAVIYLTVLIVVPLFVIGVEGLRNGLDSFWTSITRPAAISAVWLSVWTAGVMAIINTLMGTLTAYVLLQYRFRANACWIR